MKIKTVLPFLFLCGLGCIFVGIHIDQVMEQDEDCILEEREKATFSEYLGYVLWKNLNRYSYYDFDKVVKTLVAIENGQMHVDFCQNNSSILMKLFEKEENERSNHNLAEAECFLDSLKNKRKMIELKKDKVFYEVLKKGNGSPISENDLVYVHFKEMDMFENIYRDTTQTSTPVKLKLSETIPGLRCATEGMLIGEKRKIYIHPDYGYGTIGKNEPNQLSIFEIEIVSK